MAHLRRKSASVNATERSNSPIGQTENALRNQRRKESGCGVLAHVERSRIKFEFAGSSAVEGTAESVGAAGTIVASVELQTIWAAIFNR